MAIQLHDRTLKALSLILSYPTRELQQAMPEISAVLASDTRLTAAARRGLRPLVEELAVRDIYDLEEQFVLLFDRSRTLSLNLFEHVHGESRDRGQAMVDLMAVYEEGGLAIDEKELPDYLPLFLEFLSTRAEPEARETLTQTLHIITALRERLRKRKSIYANAFSALEAFAKSKPDSSLVETILAGPEDDPDDLEALDAIWEEEVVTFGGNSGENDCGPDRMQRQIRASQRRADNLEMNPNPTPPNGEAR